jgi:hypothetical protein
MRTMPGLGGAIEPDVLLLAVDGGGAGGVGGLKGSAKPRLGAGAGVKTSAPPPPSSSPPPPVGVAGAVPLEGSEGAAETVGSEVLSGDGRLVNVGERLTVGDNVMVGLKVGWVEIVGKFVPGAVGERVGGSPSTGVGASVAPGTGVGSAVWAFTSANSSRRINNSRSRRSTRQQGADVDAFGTTMARGNKELPQP